MWRHAHVREPDVDGDRRDHRVRTTRDTCGTTGRVAVSERTARAAFAIRNRPSGALPTFTHIAAGRAHICEMLKLAAALGASGMASGPLIYERLPTDMDSQLGPRSKPCGEDHATHRVGGDRPECEAIVTNLSNL
jgi:hypothetical protein